MNILEITLEAPSNFSGGGIGVKQSILSLRALGQVDYIGPHYQPDVFSESTNIQIIFELVHDNNVLSRAINAIRGVLNGYYNSWKEIETEVEWEKYDLIHVEFTKFPFLVKSVKKSSVPVFVRMHNVESEYFHNLYMMEKNLKNTISYLTYKRNEKVCLEKADRIIGLSKEDIDKIYTSFLIPYDKLEINPVCIEDNGCERNNNSKIILLTGSLWYGPNADGITWFLTKVWEKIKNDRLDASVIIAGNKPNDKLKSLCDKLDVKLVDSPEDIVPYFQVASLYVAPIFSGAGMKVKVAEAWMHGLPVIGTTHTFIGYDIADSKAACVCQSAEDFRFNILDFLNMTDREMHEISKESRELYIKKYSIEQSCRFYKKLISKNS